MLRTFQMPLVHVCLYVPCGHLLGKRLTSWLTFVVSYCEVCYFPIGILGQVWYLIVSIPDLCTLSYFYKLLTKTGKFSNRLCSQKYVNLTIQHTIMF